MSLSALVALALVVPQSDAYMRQVSMDYLAKHSDNIIRGTVVGMRSYWTPNHRAIYTDVTVSVDAQYKGRVGARQVTVTIQGGEVGEIGLRVSDMPVFRKGEDVILFLNRKGPVFEVNSLYQGKYTVERGLVKEKDVRVDEFVRKIRETVKMQER